MDLKVCFIVYIRSDPEKLLKTFGKWDRIDIDINSAFPTYIRRRRPIWPLKYWEWAKLTSEYVIYAISYVLLYVKSIPFSLIQHMLYLWWISNIQLYVGLHHLHHLISSHFIFSHFISSHFLLNLGLEYIWVFIISCSSLNVNSPEIKFSEVARVKSHVFKRIYLKLPKCPGKFMIS